VRKRRWFEICHIKKEVGEQLQNLSRVQRGGMRRIFETPTRGLITACKRKRELTFNTHGDGEPRNNGTERKRPIQSREKEKKYGEDLLCERRNVINMTHAH